MLSLKNIKKDDFMTIKIFTSDMIIPSFLTSRDRIAYFENSNLCFSSSSSLDSDSRFTRVRVFYMKPFLDQVLKMSELFGDFSTFELV